MNSHKIWCMLEGKPARFFIQTSQTLHVFCPSYRQANMTSMSKSETGVWLQQGMLLIIISRAEECMGLIKLR